MGNETQKTFVIDTNVLIHNPEALSSFRDNEIIVPLTVLEELDKLKTYSDQRGKSAREAIRYLDAAIKGGDVRSGVKLDNGSILRIPFDISINAPSDLSLEKNDNKIILLAYALQREGRRVFFVSKDINARVKAAALGLKPVDYEKQKVDSARLYTGIRTCEVPSSWLDSFFESGRGVWKDRAYHNEFIRLREQEGHREVLARYDLDDQALSPIGESPSLCGIKALNMEQRAAMELLLDDRVKCVTLVGQAGTGKTLLAIAAALHKTLEERSYSRVLVSRPVVPLGKDIGFLPGEKSAKLANWMQPIFDNLEHILSSYKKQNAKSVDQLLRERVIDVEAVTFIRGRSLPNQFIVVDEAQNLTPHEIKTVVSRAGNGSKVVLTGDPQQIDNMYLDANSNGLSFLVDAFKGERLFGHVTLGKTERSELAELAASKL